MVRSASRSLEKFIAVLQCNDRLGRDTPEKKFEVVLDAILIENRSVMMGIRKPDDDPKSPKWRFLATSKLFCAVLDMYFRDPKELAVPLL